MAQNPINALFEEAINKAYAHHIEVTPIMLPSQVRVIDEERRFLELLTPAQREAYRNFTGEFVTDMNNDENNFYYRLGFLDGLTMWRGGNV